MRSNDGRGFVWLASFLFGELRSNSSLRFSRKDQDQRVSAQPPSTTEYYEYSEHHCRRSESVFFVPESPSSLANVVTEHPGTFSQPDLPLVVPRQVPRRDVPMPSSPRWRDALPVMVTAIQIPGCYPVEVFAVAAHRWPPPMSTP